MHRKNGTSEPRSDSAAEPDVIVTYRELAPAPVLRGTVRTYFSFVPGSPVWSGNRRVLREVRFTRGMSFCAPQLAAGHASLVVELGAECHLDNGWHTGTPPRAQAIGPLRTVGSAPESVRSAMIGAYFEPGAAAGLLWLPAIELADRVVALEDIWGRASVTLAEDLAALDEVARVDLFESAILEHIQPATAPRSSVDVIGLTRWVRAHPSSMTVGRLADVAGVSRQHLSRVFREAVGVSPKRYCQLARFHAGLAYAGVGRGVRWAHVAAELGYADQSHMIAEFRQLSSLTPESLATRQWFHPFILDAQTRHASVSSARAETR